MTVKELIEHLQTLPPDYSVVYRACSDYHVLDAVDIWVQRPDVPLERGVAIAHHNMASEYREYAGPQDYKDRPLPVPAGVVFFPGN